MDLGLLVRNMRLFLNFSNILQNPIFNTFYNYKECIIYFITPNAKTCNFFNFFEKGILLKFVPENQLYFCSLKAWELILLKIALKILNAECESLKNQGIRI